MRNVCATSLGRAALSSGGRCLCPWYTRQYASIAVTGIDVVVEEQVILELKTVERLMPIHEAQILTYLKLSGLHTGLLLNFNSAVLKDGMRRIML